MKTSDNVGKHASGSLASRMSAVLKWCDSRSIAQVYKFFHGCDNSIELYEARIRLVLRTSPHTVVQEDASWLDSMEATIVALENRKAA